MISRLVLFVAVVAVFHESHVSAKKTKKEGKAKDSTCSTCQSVAHLLVKTRKELKRDTEKGANEIVGTIFSEREKHVCDEERLKSYADYLDIKPSSMVKGCKKMVPDNMEYKSTGTGLTQGAMVPVRIHTVVISTQHDETVNNEQIRAQLMEKVIKPVVGEYNADLLDDKTIFHLNPSGIFLIGGPHGDAGLTGRKIIIDTYGGWGAHGGGAFSGKDPSKVDRSAAYAARWVAKSCVAAGLCERALVQLSYAIGVAHPLSVCVDTYGTAKDGRSDAEITAIVLKNFDLRAGAIVQSLDLLRPRYQKTAAYSHFGRMDDPDFTWETIKPLTF